MNEPTILEATETKRPVDAPAQWQPPRYVLQIDPRTKLVTQREQYAWVDGSYRLEDRRQYLEYDVPIDPRKFVLEPPAKVEVADRTLDIGMPQGKMTDPEAAAAVLRKYLEALIAKDYAAAGRLYNGKPAEELRRRVEEKLKIRYLRVVSIGKAEPLPTAGPRVFQVPCEFEFEANGVKKTAGPPVNSGSGPTTHRKATVRPVVGHPDRWVIKGGI